MTTIRANLVSGVVAENPLGSGATSITMGGGLATLPSVGGGATARLIIDPEGVDVLSGSGPEIVHVTAYTTGAGSATITRGQEGTSARPHSQGVKIIHAPTKADWDEKADLAGAVFTGGVTFSTIHATGNATIDGAASAASLHVTGVSTLDGTVTFGGVASIPTANVTNLSVSTRITATGGSQTPQGTAPIVDASTGNRLFHHDGTFVYIGDIDNSVLSPHDVMFRSAGADRMQIRSAGDVIFRGNPPGSTTHESFRVAGFPSASVRGFAVNADGAVYQGGVTDGISVAINRPDPAMSINNAGGDSIQAYAGSAQTFRVDSTGTVFAAGRLSSTAIGPNSVSYGDNDNHFWESDGSGGWRFSNRWGIAGAIFRWYGGVGFTELGRLADADTSFETAMFLSYRDNGGVAHFSRVFCVHDSSLDAIVGPNGHILYVTHA